MSSLRFSTKTGFAFKQGFTIVELLIVVVVIAILAAITIVSYNGVTKSANNASLQNNLSQAASKLEIYKMNSATSGYPAALSDSGFTYTSTGDLTYVYAVAADSSSYCLASSQSGRTYYITNTTGKPQPGICNTTTGTSGTGDIATDGTSTASTTNYSVFGSASPSASLTVYADGGGSLKTGNRFYTAQTSGIKVTGLRIYNPPSSDSDFLSRSITAYAYLDDWTGATIASSTTFGSSPVATGTYSGARTAGTWTDIPFSSSFTLPKITSASGAKDLLSLVVQFSGGVHYVYMNPGPNGINNVNSTPMPGTYLSESPSVGMGINTLISPANNVYYGIDILFQPLP